MKKFFAVLLTCMLFLIGVSACAEGFSLRNNISFGDAMDEVHSKEELLIKEIDNQAEANEKYPYSLTTQNGTVAGVENSYIVYYFDNNKQLREVVYWLKQSSNADKIDAQYRSINEGLVRKYGDALGNKDGSTYAVIGSAIDLSSYSVNLMKSMGSPAGIRDYDEWVVSGNDYNVKIEQVEFYLGASRSSVEYWQVLSYTFFTDANIKDAVAEYMDKQSQIDADL